ncbi:ankyrin repeat domain-containing protein [Pedobacter kyungheensis]|uniref:ankyrin repeat domain-containing protein n=1 Tax=Pedobacter kyungheensis TaxID=1069985 RepID=UPI00068C5E77|nr:ankyrin repeat domain-containing protein [Pedobacter kyungheensis]
MENNLIKLAIGGKTEKIAELLAISTVDINMKDSVGFTVLATAAALNHYDVVKLLLEKGADPNIPNDKGNTALHHAAENNLLDIAKLLLNHHADLDATNSFGNQPLWPAVFYVRGDKRKHVLVELFLDHQADPNHKNNAGASPLSFAEKVGNTDLVALLKKR